MGGDKAQPSDERRFRCCAQWQCSALYIRSLPECPECGSPAPTFELNQTDKTAGRYIERETMEIGSQTPPP